MGITEFLRQKKSNLSSRYGLWDFIFLFLGELGDVYKIAYPQEVWNIERKIGFHKVLLKFIYKGHFLTIKKAYRKLLN
jgi:hypothetical protein